jgi:hypothetical protein
MICDVVRGPQSTVALIYLVLSEKKYGKPDDDP